MSGGILVYGELQGGELAASTRGLLDAARRLCSEWQRDLAVVLIGDGARTAAAAAAAHGADQVFAVSHPDLNPELPEPCLAVIEQLITELSPAAVLLSHGNRGIELAPRIAFRCNTGAVLDCVALRRDPAADALLLVKPIFGGGLTATYRSRFRPQVATLREQAPSPGAPPARGAGRIVEYAPGPQAFESRIRYLRRVVEELPGPKLEDADVIVCAGRGVEEAIALEQIEALARRLGGAVAGTRPLCEKGWLNRRRQVGLTGVKVTPKLYLAIGVSGAVQHMAGVVGARTIVAINKDPDAEIFRYAHFGIVGDYREILPALIDRLTERQAEG